MVVYSLRLGTIGFGELRLFFFKTGLLVFGSGLVIVPFLKTHPQEAPQAFAQAVVEADGYFK